MRILFPVPSNTPITQSYEEHVQRAQANGWCYEPGPCASGRYYYGGIDWGCPEGTLVQAAASGTVKRVLSGTIGYGKAIYLMHQNGYLTIYAHLSQIHVSPGEQVKAGQIIGLTGNTGNSTGPHLHFELRDARGCPIDPAPYLNWELPEEPASGSNLLFAITSVNVRTAPAVKPENKIGVLKAGTVIESAGGETIEADGRRWQRCIVYVAADFVEPVR